VCGARVGGVGRGARGVAAGAVEAEEGGGAWQVAGIAAVKKQRSQAV
jgi:hypothetical protein